ARKTVRRIPAGAVSGPLTGPPSHLPRVTTRWGPEFGPAGAGKRNGLPGLTGAHAAGERRTAPAGCFPSHTRSPLLKRNPDSRKPPGFSRRVLNGSGPVPRICGKRGTQWFDEGWVMGRARVSTNESVAGRYRLVEVLHRETNLRCWYADDTRTGRPCLVMESRLPEDPLGELLPHVPDRVLRTTEDVTRLCPGRMATVIEAVAEAGCLWTATTWIDGTSLGALLAEQGTFNHVRAARVGLELLDVLDAAHTVGITHGELGPGHVFVRDTGPVVVTGWGLSQATDAP